MGDSELERKLTELLDMQLVKWESVPARINELMRIKDLISSSKQQNQYKEGRKLVKALNQPTRLDILMSIDKGASCPCELEFITGLAQATVSHHLTILDDAGLISRDRKGKWTLLKSEKHTFLKTLFDL
ncbi:MAG: winged helix-turn-helix transcriptional regulator [Candidatus Heimdallarchaeota archaeon]|nr:MAG: winged helix-turn-helix transcriptional regulator [Candidatus Heimdallarchaeota archaeon]